ncbi:MAG: hypothetical protein EBR82_47535 [Caulobacteraceae bacterium]|nr:hypothetical protein [Caulobacteraceae bacterium]
MNMTKAKLMLASWARSFATAALTCYMTYEVVTWKIVMNAGLAALIPMIIRYLNPKDATFGRQAQAA